MKTRLPVPHSDHSEWGHILNNYLLVSHTDKGGLRDAIVGTPTLRDGAVTMEKLAPSVLAAVRTSARSLKAAPVDDVELASSTAAISSTTQPSYAPEDYGCARYATSAINDAAIAAAITAATAANGVVQFSASGPYSVATAISQDVSKFVVRGVKTILNVDDSFSGSAFWSIYSSADYPYSYNQGVAIDGIVLQGAPLGGTPLATAAIRIGHATFLNNSLFSITNVGLQGFATGFQYIQNAWRIKVSNCRVTGGVAFSAGAGLANFGENMLVENCMIESYNPTVSIASGEWNFINCSFDGTAINANGNTVMRLLGCHLEPHTTFPCLTLTHSQATVILDNSSLVLDPNIVITTSPFSVISSNVSYGLLISNLDTIQSANFNPQTQNTDCLLVSGGGHVSLQGFASNVTGYGFVIASSLNIIYNGDAEKGTTAGWTTYATYGGPASLTVDNTTAKTGTHSLKLTAAASSIYVGQSAPCRPGQWLFAQCWNKLSITSGTGNTFIDVDFLSAKGDVILTTGYTNTTSTTDWAFHRLAGTSCIAPAGTAAARVYIGLVGSGAINAWYDDIIINIG